MQLFMVQLAVATALPDSRRASVVKDDAYAQLM
jgi:hypothetical protein